MRASLQRARPVRAAVLIVLAIAVLAALRPTPVAAVSSSTATTLAVGPDPSEYGRPETFTATVTTSDGSGPAGLVNFLADGAVIGSASLSPGAPAQAAYSTRALSPGTHDLSAVYAGDATHDGSAAASVAHRVIPSQTMVFPGSSPNPSTPDQPVVLTASLLGVGAMPDLSYVGVSGDPIAGGRNGFLQGDLNSITVAGSTSSLTVLVSGREAWSITLAAPSGGQLHAGTYSGANLPSGTPGPAPGLEVHSDGPSCTQVSGDFTILSIEAAPDGTVRGVSAAFNQHCNGASAVLQGTVHVPALVRPTGTITFRDGSTVLGVSTLDGTRLSAAMTLPPLTRGGHALSAEYSGDSHYAGDPAPDGPATITQRVGSVPTVTVTSTPNPSVRLTDVSFAVAVSAPPGAPTPTGQVTVYVDNAAVLGNTLDGNGRTMVGDGVLDTGQHTVTAVYGGDAVTQGASSSPLTQTVVASPGGVVPTMTVTTSAAPVATGDHLTIGVTVAGLAGSPPPAGTVHLTDGKVNLSPVLLVDGGASLEYVAAAPGMHTLTGWFAGDGTYTTASASTVEAVTGQDATALDLSSSSSPSVPGQRIDLVAQVVGGGAGAPTGSVTVSDGGTVLGTVPLDPTGAAQLLLVPSPGVHRFTATYGGDAIYTGSSGALTHEVVDATPNRRLVNQLYNDILGRPGDAGAAAWATELDRHRIDRTHVALALTSSDEYLTGQVQATYLVHLGREADPQGLAFWVGYIHRGATFEDLEISFLGTPEYYRGSGNTDDTFLTALYADVFGRDIDPGGRTYWVGRLAHGAPAWLVAASVVRSHEAMSNRVTDDYRLLLGRDPDPGGRDSWTALLQHGTRDETLLAQLAGSDEYWNLTQAY